MKTNNVLSIEKQYENQANCPKPFLDLDSQYVKYYYDRISNLVEDILKQDFSDVQLYKVPDKYAYGKWKFRVIKSPKDGLQLKNFYSERLKEIILDRNIPTVSWNSFDANSNIKEHVDPPYYGKNLWRILVPLSAEDSYITSEYLGTFKVEVGKPFILDFVYDKHSGENKSKTIDLTFLCFDILYEKDQDYTGEHFSNSELYRKVLNIDMGAYEKCES